jgi:hypothetical protein
MKRFVVLVVRVGNWICNPFLKNRALCLTADLKSGSWQRAVTPANLYIWILEQLYYLIIQALHSHVHLLPSSEFILLSCRYIEWSAPWSRNERINSGSSCGFPLPLRSVPTKSCGVCWLSCEVLPINKDRSALKCFRNLDRFNTRGTDDVTRRQILCLTGY